MEIKIKKLHPGAKMPAYATADAACFDLHAATVDGCQHIGGVIHEGYPITCETGLAFEIPQGNVMLTKKDYSLLRPFDLEAAKAGAGIVALVDIGTEIEPRAFVTGPDRRGYYVMSADEGVYRLGKAHEYRMAPLCWVEGKPVYPGDALEVVMVASDPVCFVVGHVDEDKCLVATNRNHFIPIADGNAAPCLRWPRPKPVKRWINIYPNTGYDTKAAADQAEAIGRIACIEIELPPLKP